MELLIELIQAICILLGILLFIIVLVASPLLGIAIILSAGLTYLITKNNRSK
jgi:hypothetical protein